MKKRVTRLGGLLAAYQRRDPAAGCLHEDAYCKS